MWWRQAYNPVNLTSVKREDTARPREGQAVRTDRDRERIITSGRRVSRHGHPAISVERSMAGATGLEPAASGVTGLLFILTFQWPLQFWGAKNARSLRQ